MSFSTQQTAALAADLDRRNVAQRQGGGGKQLSYIEGWHAIAEANRIFGFDGWSSETVALSLVSDGQRDGKTAVTYTARVRITVYAGDRVLTREGVGAGHGFDRDAGQSHEKAVKEAETDARKRGLMTFGNPFGLALYDKTQESVSTNVPDAMADPAPRQPDPEPKTTQSTPKTEGKPSHVIAPAKDAKALALDRQEAEKAKAAERAHESEVTKRTLMTRLSEMKPGSKTWDADWSVYSQTAKAMYSKLGIADKATITKAENKRRDQHRDVSRLPETDPDTGEIVEAA